MPENQEQQINDVCSLIAQTFPRSKKSTTGEPRARWDGEHKRGFIQNDDYELCIPDQCFEDQGVASIVWALGKMGFASALREETPLLLLCTPGEDLPGVRVVRTFDQWRLVGI